MTNIILCGGSGTRLWPISRTLMPKQFVKMFNEKSLFQLTVKRNTKVCDSQFIVSNIEQYFLAVDQLEELSNNPQSSILNSQFLLEPVGRNTAPAIALACMKLPPDEIVLVTPSDHLVKNEEEYIKVIAAAKGLAEDGNLVTFGIKPSFAETGFGYIEADGYDVKEFHEKPDAVTAQRYVDAGNYYWNSGMFCFQAGIFLEELQKHSPEIFKACKKAFENAKQLASNQLRITHEYMSTIPEDSIDYAVMEKTLKAKVVPSDIGWSDVGSFDALSEELKMDNEEWIMEEDSKDNFYYSDDKKKVIATIGLEEYIVIDTKDALLISKKGQTQKIKNIVNQLKIIHYPLLTTHLIVHRPWGAYTVLEDTPGYKIKRIVVKPGKRLSLKKHFHRNEHWIVVSGTATVTIGNEVKLIRPNESTYIKMGEVHRLENKGKIPVILIEAQVGEYTGEDDIVRIEDDFARESKI